MPNRISSAASRPQPTQNTQPLPAGAREGLRMKTAWAGSLPDPRPDFFWQQLSYQQDANGQLEFELRNRE